MTTDRALTFVFLSLALTSSALPDFGAPMTYPVGSQPMSVVVADLNRDGLGDAVVTNTITRDLSVRLGTACGLDAENRLDPGEGTPHEVEIGDVDGDGTLDLVVVMRDPPHSLSVMLGRGDGTFEDPTGYGPSRFAHALELVDLDGDLDLDVAIVNASFEGTAGSVDILLNDGSAVFSFVGSHTYAEFPFAYIADLASGDVNGDGLADLAAIANVTGAASVLINAGAGDFLPAETLPLGQVGPGAIEIVDVNGDSKLDVLVLDICQGNDALRVGLNDGSGTFSLAQALPLPDACHSFTHPSGLDTGDVDDDGLIDVLLTRRSHDVATSVLGLGNGTFAVGNDIPTDDEPMDVELADLGGDGDEDFLVASLAGVAELRPRDSWNGDTSSLRLTREGGDLVLSWQGPTASGWTWNVYRDVVPDSSVWGSPLETGVTDGDAQTPRIQYRDQDGANSGGVAYYLVTSVNECGESPL